MSDDIDLILTEARLRSKFAGAVSEFSDLLEFVDEYVSTEEIRVESGEDISEKEVFAMDLVASDAAKVEEDLNKIRNMLEGGLG